MRILMLETRSGSPDGATVRVYEHHREYDLPESLARVFVTEGWAKKVSRAGRKPGAPSGKALAGAPENKARRGRPPKSGSPAKTRVKRRRSP